MAATKKKAKAKTYTEEDLLRLSAMAVERAMADREAVEDSASLDPENLKPAEWEMVEKGPNAGKLKYVGPHAKLLMGSEKWLPEKISDWFLDMKTKTVLPYTRLRAVMQYKRGYIICASNGGMYFGRKPEWKEHPITDRVRKPLPLTRMMVDYRHAGVNPIITTNFPGNHTGWILCDVNGRPAQLNASELPLGLPRQGGNAPHGDQTNEFPTWNDIPITFSTGG